MKPGSSECQFTLDQTIIKEKQKNLKARETIQCRATHTWTFSHQYQACIPCLSLVEVAHKCWSTAGKAPTKGSTSYFIICLILKNMMCNLLRIILTATEFTVWRETETKQTPLPCCDHSPCCHRSWHGSGLLSPALTHSVLHSVYWTDWSWRPERVGHYAGVRNALNLWMKVN